MRLRLCCRRARAGSLYCATFAADCTIPRAALEAGHDAPSAGKRSELFTWKLRPPWPPGASGRFRRGESQASGALLPKKIRARARSLLTAAPAFGLRSPRVVASKPARVSLRVAPATPSRPALRKNISIRGGRVGEWPCACAPPLQKKSSTLSVEKARRERRYNFYAPCRKVLSSGVRTGTHSINERAPKRRAVEEGNSKKAKEGESAVPP